MSLCIVPDWNLRHQGHEQDEDGGEKRSSHMHNQYQGLSDAMSNYEVAELAWVNGQLVMHGLGGINQLTSTKPMRTQNRDTLDSVIHQSANHQPQSPDYLGKPENLSSFVASSGGKWSESSCEDLVGLDSSKKRVKPEAGPWQKQCSNNIPDGLLNSIGTPSFQETETNTMTWASFESPGSLETRTANEDSACRSELRNLDEELENKTESGRFSTTRRSRDAAVHNQSERRRRDRINEKMKTLQKLVPNSNKTDKASILDEVIVYLKQLQAQLRMLSARNMPQMMMPLGVQQHLQMPLLAHMGMGMGLGMGMGMLDTNTVNRPQTISSILHPNRTAAATTFIPPPFLVPPLMPAHAATRANLETVANHSIPLPDPYSAFVMQSMNIDLYNKIVALYNQQINHATQTSASANLNNVPHD